MGGRIVLKRVDLCKNCALWEKMLASANAKMQKPRVKRALCLAGAGAGEGVCVLGLSLSAVCRVESAC